MSTMLFFNREDFSSEGSEEEGYESWTNAELSEELERRGLTKSGTKAEMVARLTEDDAA